MNRKRHQSSHLRPFRIAVAVGTLGLALLVWPSDTFADGGHGKYHKKHGKGHGVVLEPFRHHSGHGHGHHYAPRHQHRRFAVPRTIHKQHRRAYEPYYYGRVYHRTHRHHHVIYRFPVYYQGPGYGYGQPVYQPYAYCGTELFAQGIFTPHGPSFSFGFSIVR